jgi:hypothetical protein
MSKKKPNWTTTIEYATKSGKPLVVVKNHQSLDGLFDEISKFNGGIPSITKITTLPNNKVAAIDQVHSS